MQLIVKSINETINQSREMRIKYKK